MNVSIDDYVEVVGALEANTPETPYEIILDEFTADMSDKIKQAGRYVDITFLGYAPATGLNYSITPYYYVGNSEEYPVLKQVGVIEYQEKDYYLASLPAKMHFQGNYFQVNNSHYDLVSNPANPESFTEAELLNTNYPKFSNNPYIVRLTYLTMNTTSDYRNMFDNCANLEYVLFWGPCANRYSNLQKANMVVNCPKLEMIGIADDGMVDVLEGQLIDSLETLIITYDVQRIPASASSNKLGIRPFTSVDVTGKTDDCFIESRIGEYKFFVGNVTGSTDANPVSVVISDPENLKHGIIITD